MTCHSLGCLIYLVGGGRPLLARAYYFRIFLCLFHRVQTCEIMIRWSLLIPSDVELNNDTVELILIPSDVELNNDRV